MTDRLHADHDAFAREQALVAAVRIAVAAFGPSSFHDGHAAVLDTDPRDRPVGSAIPHLTGRWT